MILKDENITINLGLEKPLISNAVSKVKAYIGKELLVELILGGKKSNEFCSKLKDTGFINNEVDDSTKAEIEHWYKRNWTLSLNYYLWSHTSHLFDQGSNYKEKQIKAIESYLELDGMPVGPRIASNISINLGKLEPLPKRSLGDVLLEREAVLATPIRSIKLSEVNSILWYGLKEFREFRKLEIEENLINAVNSFGAAFDIYLCIYTVDSLKSGIYFYDSVKHEIELVKGIKLPELRAKMYECQFDQKAAHTASFSIMLVSHFERYQWRYRHEAALRQIYINCGQIMHPLMLLSTLYNYKTHISPAISDSLALDLVGLDKAEFQVMYILSIG